MENTLFDEKNLNKLVQEFEDILEINDEKQNVIKKWLELLEEGALEEEIPNYSNFQDIILRQLLGYSSENFQSNYVTEGRESVEFVLFNKYGEAYVAIELKGSKKNFNTYRNHNGETIMQQASRYATSQKSFEWCIASNYETFCFFNKQSRGEYISFNFDELTNDEILKKFLLIFSKVSLIDIDIPTNLLEETRIIDKDFEDEFYKLFSETRLMLIKELETNSDLNKNQAIHYAQLILNRYIFICFAEDKGLIPQYTNEDTISTPIKLGNISHRRPRIWDRLNELFVDIYEGRSAKNIMAFDGDIFEEDLSFLKIRDYVEKDFFDDCKIGWKFEDKDLTQIDRLMYGRRNINLIYYNLLLISHFNFNTELDVNILGHICENSIGDLEDIINGKNNDFISERNQLGVFYTPEPITEYISNNSILSFLSKSKKINSISDLIKEYYNDNIDEIEDLEEKLKNIKILDLACGSGAFLNKATDILLEIYSRIHHIKAEKNAVYEESQKRTGEKSTVKYYPLETFDENRQRKEIILNNIFGVDINPEAVELTKLGIFLKVAKKGLHLPVLDENIKCGNSVINSDEYDKYNSFDWELQFKEIMENGGFDVIIGNPPYVRQELITQYKGYFKENYECYVGTADLYVYFIEKSLKLLKSGGIYSIICSSKFSKAGYGKLLRRFIVNNFDINLYEDYSSEQIFTDATTYPCIIKITNKKTNDNQIFVDREFYMNQNRLDDTSWVFKPEYILELKDKIEQGNKILKNNPKLIINRGLTTGCNDAFVINEEQKNQLITDDIRNLEYIKPLLRGQDLKKWKVNYKKLYILLTKNGIDIDEIPLIKSYLNQFREQLNIRSDKGDEWYNLRSCNYYDDFEKPKLLYSRMVKSFFTVYDEENFFLLDSAFMITSTENDKIYLKALSGILSSNVINFYISLIADVLRGRTFAIKKIYIEQLPIPLLCDNNKQKLSDFVDILQLKNDNLKKEIFNHIKWFKRKCELNDISPKLKQYYLLSFEDFLKEIKEISSINFSKEIEEELENEFDKSILSIKDLNQNILLIELQMNKLVYDLYNLSSDEIHIIENNI